MNRIIVLDAFCSSALQVVGMQLNGVVSFCFYFVLFCSFYFAFYFSLYFSFSFFSIFLSSFLFLLFFPFIFSLYFFLLILFSSGAVPKLAQKEKK